LFVDTQQYCRENTQHGLTCRAYHHLCRYHVYGPVEG
jgi:hypothetical protein